MACLAHRVRSAHVAAAAAPPAAAPPPAAARASAARAARRAHAHAHAAAAAAAAAPEPAAAAARGAARPRLGVCAHEDDDEFVRAALTAAGLTVDPQAPPPRRRPSRVSLEVDEYECRLAGGAEARLLVARSRRAASGFDGLAAAAEAINASGAVRAPRVMCVGDLPSAERGGSFALVEALSATPLGASSEEQRKLGEALGKLHLGVVEAGSELAPEALGAGKRAKKKAIGKPPPFGFRHDTRLGDALLDNGAVRSWAMFFTERRMGPALRDALGRLQRDYDAKRHGDDPPHSPLANELATVGYEARRVGWELLAEQEVRKEGGIMPALLHGDLHAGNAGIDADGKVVLFGAASYLGHSEADLAFRGWAGPGGADEGTFPGLTQDFYDAYHDVVPRDNEDFEARAMLYKMYHMLNHVALYGEPYAVPCLSLMATFLNEAARGQRDVQPGEEVFYELLGAQRVPDSDDEDDESTNAVSVESDDAADESESDSSDDSDFERVV